MACKPSFEILLWLILCPLYKLEKTRDNSKNKDILLLTCCIWLEEVTVLT